MLGPPSLSSFEKICPQTDINPPDKVLKTASVVVPGSDFHIMTHTRRLTRSKQYHPAVTAGEYDVI